jgi:hypothetical protein
MKHYRLPCLIHRKIARSKMDTGYGKKSLRLAIKIQATLILRSLKRLLPLFRRMGHTFQLFGKQILALMLKIVDFYLHIRCDLIRFGFDLRKLFIHSFRGAIA